MKHLFKRPTFAALKMAMLLVLFVVALMFGSTVAQAHFVDGFLAQCTAVGAGTCTESTAAGYSRQLIWMSPPAKGLSVNQVPYYFGPAAAGSIAGHALYTALTGGTVIMVLPLAAPVTFGGSNLDAADVGSLGINYTGLAAYFNSDWYSANVTSLAAFGTTLDGSTVTAGQALTIARGLLNP